MFKSSYLFLFFFLLVLGSYCASGWEMQGINFDKLEYLGLSQPQGWLAIASEEQELVEVQALVESQIGVAKQTQGNVVVEEGNAQALEQTHGTVVAPKWIQENLEVLECI
jgi:hypothetical protein